MITRQILKLYFSRAWLNLSNLCLFKHIESYLSDQPSLFDLLEQVQVVDPCKLPPINHHGEKHAPSHPLLLSRSLTYFEKWTIETLQYLRKTIYIWSFRNLFNAWTSLLGSSPMITLSSACGYACSPFEEQCTMWMASRTPKLKRGWTEFSKTCMRRLLKAINCLFCWADGLWLCWRWEYWGKRLINFFLQIIMLNHILFTSSRCNGHDRLAKIYSNTLTNSALQPAEKCHGWLLDMFIKLFTTRLAFIYLKFQCLY